MTSSPRTIFCGGQMFFIGVFVATPLHSHRYGMAAQRWLSDGSDKTVPGLLPWPAKISCRYSRGVN